MKQENTTSTQNSIRGYILGSINIPDLNNDLDIFEAGIVNSLFAIELMTFLEKTFNIKVTMDDLDMENFKSVTAAAGFVERKRTEAGTA